MPRVKVLFFREADGSIPAKEWLVREVAARDRRALAKIGARLSALRKDGWDLRRPSADTLERGIYELRVEFGHVHYRLLYFFAVGPVAVIVHGLTKEGKVPHNEISLAVHRKELYELDPERYAYDEEEEKNL